MRLYRIIAAYVMGVREGGGDITLNYEDDTLDAAYDHGRNLGVRLYRRDDW